MKAIAAVAIARSFTINETASAGLFVSAIIGCASITGLLHWLGRVVPVPVVKGIQVGAGLSLVLSAGSTLLQPLGWLTPTAGDNLLWAAAAFLLLLATTQTSTMSSRALVRVPYALIVFLLGLVIACVTLLHKSSQGSRTQTFSFWHPRTFVPSASDFRTGALTAGLGQIPLTTLNSIIAVTHLSAELLPSQPVPSESSIGLSVAMMNLVGCWFGAMPVCHGSGGLAAQYRFGARSGASVICLGAIKLILGLFIDEDWLMGLLGEFPHALLGTMVVAAGIELIKVGENLNVTARDLWEETRVDEEDTAGKSARQLTEEERRDRWLVMITTVAGLLTFKNDAVGFVVGLLCHWWLRSPSLFKRAQPSSRTAGVGLLQEWYTDEDPETR